MSTMLLGFEILPGLFSALKLSCDVLEAGSIRPYVVAFP